MTGVGDATGGWTDAHVAVELGDLDRLGRLLDTGTDVNEEAAGLTLLHHAVDVELDSHVQSGDPLSCAITEFLLERGADPLRKSGGGTGVSALHMAYVNGHNLAYDLFQRHLDLLDQESDSMGRSRAGGEPGSTET